MTQQATWTQTLKAMAIEVVYYEHSKGRDWLKCESILWTDFMVCLDFKGMFWKKLSFSFLFATLFHIAVMHTLIVSFSMPSSVYYVIRLFLHHWSHDTGCNLCKLTLTCHCSHLVIFLIHFNTSDYPGYSSMGVSGSVFFHTGRSDTDFIANIGGQCWQTHDIVWPIACLKDMLTFSIFDIVPVKRASQTDWSSSNQCNGNGCLMKCQKTSGSVFNHFDPNEMWKRCLTSYFDISLGVHQHCISTSASLAGPYLVTGAMSKIKSVNTLVEVRKWENRA